MNQEYGNEYNPPIGNTHSQPLDSNDVIQDVKYTPVNETAFSGGTGAMPVLHQRVPEWRLRKRGETHPEQNSVSTVPTYTEPSYCAPNDMMATMYTPGINVNRHVNTGYHRKREAHEAVSDSAPSEPKHRTKRAGRVFRTLCLIIVCALVSAAATYGVMEYRIRAGYHTTVNQVVLGGTNPIPQGARISAPTSAFGTGMAAEDIYDMALTQVVGIKTEVPTIGFFGTFGTNTAAGSGFIISADGYILTNFHVVEPALQHNLPISVTMSSGDEFVAEVVGYEQANDVALLKIEATGLNPAVLGNSDNIRVGQKVYAIGNPFGTLVYTMTDGIVSARDRDVTVEGRVINTFQFSAAVNRGNSGGPIYDANGEVIGIVTAKLVRSDIEGIGFAIPINDAIEIASGLIEHGYITGRPLIGISGQSVTSTQADYYELVVGAFVRVINPDSAAENAGLEVGDIIVELGDTAVTCMETLRLAMRRYRADETTSISVWRGGDVMEFSITFDEDLEAGQPGRWQRAAIQEPEPEARDRFSIVLP